MIDLRRLTRGIVLQALYELDITQRPLEDILSNLFQHDDETVHMVGYLSLRRLQEQADHVPMSTTFDLCLKASPEYTPIQLMLVDILTAQMDKENIDETHFATIEHTILRPEAQDVDLPFHAIEDILGPTDFRRVLTLVRRVHKHRQQLDGAILRYVDHFPVEQVSPIDLNILRLALYELAFSGKTPIPIAIDEAIELAKVFGDELSARFVNGVLRKLSDQYDLIRAEFKTQQQVEP